MPAEPSHTSWPAPEPVAASPVEPPHTPWPAPEPVAAAPVEQPHTPWLEPAALAPAEPTWPAPEPVAVAPAEPPHAAWPAPEPIAQAPLEPPQSLREAAAWPFDEETVAPTLIPTPAEPEPVVPPAAPATCLRAGLRDTADADGAAAAAPQRAERRLEPFRDGAAPGGGAAASDQAGRAGRAAVRATRCHRGATAGADAASCATCAAAIGAERGAASDPGPRADRTATSAGTADGPRPASRPGVHQHRGGNGEPARAGAGTAVTAPAATRPGFIT